MNQTNKNYARTLNRRLKQWDESGIESDLVEETRADLEMFYDKWGIEADDNFFTTNAHLSEEAEAELERIMDSFGNNAGSSIKEMERSYNEKSEEYKERFGVDSFEDYINFTDKMKNAMSNADIKNIISSEQIAELYAVASSKNMGADFVDYTLMMEYQSSGKTFEALYNQILGAIDSYDETMEFGWS